MKERNIDKSLLFYIEKELKKISNTVSLKKIEESLEKKDNPRVLQILPIYLYANNKRVDAVKYKNISKTLKEYINHIEEDQIKFGKEITFGNNVKNNKFQNKYSDFIKMERIINSNLKKKSLEIEAKEVVREKIEKFIFDNSTTYRSASKLFDVDYSNLHKFVAEKEYNRMSIESLMKIRGIIKNA